MPYYKCTFVNDKGNFIDKTIFSDSKKELKNSFLNADEKLIYIKKIYFKELSFSKLFSRKIGYTEFYQFNQKMITLLKSGVSFIRALEIIIQNTESGNFKEILIKSETDIKNGVQISDAFSSNQIPFQRIYRASLLAGEKSGNIDSILEKFNIYLGKISSLRRRTISSLTYPIILFVFMISMVLLILLYAIPVFSSFYDNFEADLPGVTIFLISLANFLKRNILIIVFAIFILYISVRLLEKFNKNIVIRDLIKLKLPFVKRIVLENAMAVFSRTLSILIAGGIPVPEATGIAIETFSNKYFMLKVKDIPVKIKGGYLLSDVLKEVNIFPGIMVEVIRIGESSGNLVDVLDKNADFFESAIDSRINTLISLIEPILIIVLGFVIAFMLISVYLPIFSLVRVVR